MVARVSSKRLASFNDDKFADQSAEFLPQSVIRLVRELGKNLDTIDFLFGVNEVVPRNANGPP